jgi:hypothetical protein
MLHPFVSLMGLRRDRHSSMEDRTSFRRPRRATPQFETLEKIIALSNITVSATATQTEIAKPTVDITASADALGNYAKAINYITANEHIHFGAQSQTVLVGVGQQGPTQGGQSPGNTIIVNATATQTETASPTVDRSATATASGNHAVDIHVIVVNMNILVGVGQQGPTQGDQSLGNTVIVNATATQTETASPTVDLSAAATASGNHAVAINFIIVNMNIWSSRQSQTVLVGAGQQGPSQGGQGPGNTVIVSETATQTEIASPWVNLTMSAHASGQHAKTFNHINVDMDIQFGAQSQTVLVGAGPISSGPGWSESGSFPRPPEQLTRVAHGAGREGPPSFRLGTRPA